MSKDEVESQLKRARALLSQKRTNVELHETSPEHSPHSIGAADGLGFEASDPKVTASVYVFEDAGAHADAVKKLSEGLSGDGVRVLHSTNGPLLFFGHTQTDGPDGRTAKYRLSDLVSAFSGNE